MKDITRSDYHQRILTVLIHIQTHLDDALDLDFLAGLAHFSPYHFHRVFRGLVGESVMAHVRRLRLERSAMRLRFTDQPVTHIAFEAGYETHEAYTRAFRDMFHRSPSEYRAAEQIMPFPAATSGVHFDPDGCIKEFQAQDEGGQKMDVRIENMQPQRVAFMRHVGPYNEVGQTWQRLMAWAGPKGIFGPTTTCLSIYHDDPEITPPDKLRADACVTVGPSVQPEGEVGIQELAGGQYAVYTHKGPYEKLGEAYAALCGQWLPTSGREPGTAPPFEVYRNNPQTTKPEDLLTDIYLALKQT
jgi:AraC family transcriptional regulator